MPIKRGLRRLNWGKQELKPEGIENWKNYEGSK